MPTRKRNCQSVGKLSAVRFVRLHPLSLFCCYVYPQPDTIDGYWRRIHASVGLYVSVRGDAAAAVVCFGAALKCGCVKATKFSFSY